MPRRGKAEGRAAAGLTEWARRGAHDPCDGSPAASKTIDLAESRMVWAFQPVQAARFRSCAALAFSGSFRFPIPIPHRVAGLATGEDQIEPSVRIEIGGFQIIGLLLVHRVDVVRGE